MAYSIVRGSGAYWVHGKEISVREGTFMGFDPETTHVPVAGPNVMTFVAVGSRRGSYEQRESF